MLWWMMSLNAHHMYWKSGNALFLPCIDIYKCWNGKIISVKIKTSKTRMFCTESDPITSSCQVWYSCKISSFWFPASSLSLTLRGSLFGKPFSLCSFCWDDLSTKWVFHFLCSWLWQMEWLIDLVYSPNSSHF